MIATQETYHMVNIWICEKGLLLDKSVEELDKNKGGGLGCYETLDADHGRIEIVTTGPGPES